jgi:hypothetical protein
LWRRSKIITKQILEEQYLNNNLSQRKLAASLKISRRDLRYHLNKFSIKKKGELVRKSMENTLFILGHKVNLGRERPDMFGNKKGKLFEVGAQHLFWKGDFVGYNALHSWIYRNLGKAQKCELHPEHMAKRYHWANISRYYKRDKNDFIQLCPSCHYKYDIKGMTLEEIKNG